MADGDTARYDPSPYLAVLDEFKREGHRRARWAGWLTLIVLLPIVIAIAALFDLPLICSLGFWLVLAALAVAAFLECRNYLRVSAWVRAFVVHLRERLVADGGAQDKP